MHHVCLVMLRLCQQSGEAAAASKLAPSGYAAKMSAAVQLVFLTLLLATVQACRAADEIVNRCDLCSAHNSSYRDAAEISGRNQVAAAC